ncbi:MAG: hypothetical protein V7756_05485 [Halopseudomonas sp.]|uniref:hypothetical protein n=1 Tax=Halopseudomonas sp. TaxID=2901191 RepID=UPI003001D4DD
MDAAVSVIKYARIAWAGATLALLQACANQIPATEPTSGRMERELVSHSLHIDVGEPRVLASPHRSIKVTESRLFTLTQFDSAGNQLDQQDQFQSLPWANQQVELVVGKVRVSRQTDQDGQLRLNLLDEDFVGLDFDEVRIITLSVSAGPGVQTDATLLVGRELRSKLREAEQLIYDNLEEDDVNQWVYRVQRLAALGLDEESSQLENMLILLTTGDPQLQGDFIQALGEATTQE